jgi:predicted ATPase
MAADPEAGLDIAVAGPCASGKSTLVAALRESGYTARQIAQEHSYVAGMWRRNGRPDVLIFLDADYPAIMRRRPRFKFSPADLAEQQRRLAEAYAQADLRLDTSNLAPAEVSARAFAYLKNVNATGSAANREGG